MGNKSIVQISLIKLVYFINEIIRIIAKINKNGFGNSNTDTKQTYLTSLKMAESCSLTLPISNMYELLPYH